jgi:hypothetical protein
VAILAPLHRPSPSYWFLHSWNLSSSWARLQNRSVFYHEFANVTTYPIPGQNRGYRLSQNFKEFGGMYPKTARAVANPAIIAVFPASDFLRDPGELTGIIPV